MTITTSWDVFEDLRYAQDELLRMTRMPAQWLARMGPQPGSGHASQVWAPAVDITEHEDTYLVTAEVPGVVPADLEVTFQDGLLTIQGERRRAEDVPARRPTAPSAATELSAGRSACLAAFRRTKLMPPRRTASCGS